MLMEILDIVWRGIVLSIIVFLVCRLTVWFVGGALYDFVRISDKIIKVVKNEELVEEDDFVVNLVCVVWGLLKILFWTTLIFGIIVGIFSGLIYYTLPTIFLIILCLVIIISVINN